MNKVTVSIIVASYNYEQYIAETLDSLIAQTYSDWEALVIDDGSKDNSVEIISEYAKKDHRIKLLQHPGKVNKGLAKSLEYAIQHAQGRFIAFCESDDSLYPESLEEHVRVLNKYKNVSLCYSSVELVGEEKFTKKYIDYIDLVREKLINLNKSFDGRDMLENNNPVFSFSCVMVKADALKRCSFNPPYIPFLDWWLWKQLACYGKIAFIDKKLTKWRIHGDSLMHRVDDLEKRNQQINDEARILLNKIEEEKVQAGNNFFYKKKLLPNGYKVRILGLNIYRVEKKDSKKIKKIFGITIKGKNKKTKLDALKKKVKKYRFLSFFPIPFLQKKLKKRYKKNKLYYQMLLEESRRDGTDVSLIGVSDNEASILKCYARGRKKILLASHEASNTGAPRALLEVAKVLKKNNFDVVFLSPRDGNLREDCERDNIPFIVDEGLHYLSINKIHLERFARFASSFDVVMINSAANIVIAQALKKTSVRKVWWLHEGDSYFLHHVPVTPEGFLELCESMDGVYAVGEYAIQCTNRYVTRDVAQNFLYGLPDRSDDVLKYRNKAHDRIVFGILGTLEPRKGQLGFVEAVKLLPPDIRAKAEFIVLGGQKAFPEYVVKMQNIAKDIEELVFIADLPHEKFLEQLANIDVVVSFSEDDPMPIVLTEGLMCNKLIVCTDKTGTASLIDDGKNGFVISSKDISALKDKMEYIIGNDHLIKDLAETGREIYNKNFSQEIFEKNILRIMDGQVKN